MLSLLLAFTLNWTAPAVQISGAPIGSPVSWTIYRLQPQSPTWLAHLGGKLALADSAGADSLWREWWPSVRTDDAPRVVASGPWTLAQVGKAMSVTFADTSLHGTFFVTHTNAKGECVNWSNLCTR